MKRKKNFCCTLLIIVLILSIGIGYAYLSSELNFEVAAELRDKLVELKSKLQELEKE